MMFDGKKLVEMYRMNRGAGETPPHSNRGALPDAAYRYVNDGADPAKVSVDDRQWCAETYCYLLHLCGFEPCPKTMSTGGLYDFAQAHGSVIWIPRDFKHNGELQKKKGSVNLIMPGDAVLVLDESKRTGFRHTACVANMTPADIKKLTPSSSVPTWAGNENDIVQQGIRPLASVVIVRVWK